MFKPTLGNLWDYIVDEGCLRTDCGTEEYLIKWNGQHRVPVKLDEISGGATKYGITIPEERADKEVTLIEDLPFDEKSIFMHDTYFQYPTYERPMSGNDALLHFVTDGEDGSGQGNVEYEFPILGYKTTMKPFYSSLDRPEGAERDNLEYGDQKIIIDFFGKPVLLTFVKIWWDEEEGTEEWDTFLDSQGNPLKAKFSNFSFDDTTVKGFESLHFEMDGIKFNMNPHFPYGFNGFKFDDENMEQKDGIDYNEVLKTAQKYVTDTLNFDPDSSIANFYSLFYSRYKTGPRIDNTARWLQGADIYGGKTTEIYDNLLNKKFIADMLNPQSFVDKTAGIMPGHSEEIDGHIYNEATFVVGDKNEPEFIKGLIVTINDESNYESQPTKEGDAELTLIDNVLSSLTNEQKYSLFVFFGQAISWGESLIIPKEYFESEETFRTFMVSLLSSEWEIIDQR